MRKVKRASSITLALVATATALTGLAPSQAQAQTALLPTPGDLLGQGLGQTVKGLTCDPARTLLGPLGPLGTAVSDLLCDIDVLDFSVYTVLRRPDGSTVARETKATIGLPTLVEVGDGDLLPDLMVTFIPLSTSQFRLNIDRAPLELSNLPVSVEMVANDPTHGSLPRQRIAFGYDARASRAPQGFWSQIRVGESAVEPGAATLAISYKTQSPGASLDVIGGLFNGTLANRTDPVGARLSYTPMPANAGLELVVGKRLAARLTTDTPTRLTVDAEQVQGANELRAHALIDKLPGSLEAIYDPIAADRRKVTYNASSSVGTFTFDYSDKRPPDSLQATVKASGLPNQMTIEQTGARSGTFDALGQSVGSVEAGFSQNGTPRLLPGATKPYGYVVEQGGVRSYAGRIDGLKKAAFDASKPIVVDAQLVARTPFTVKVDTPDLQVNGILQDLPTKVHVFADLDKGLIDYDGFGDTIDLIDVDASQPVVFFDRVKRVKATIRQLPPKVTVTLLSSAVGKDSQGNDVLRKGLDVKATPAVGSIEGLLASDPADPAPPGVAADRQGLSVIDTPARFSAFGRVSGLSAARYLGGIAKSATVAELPLEAHVEHNAGPFDMRYETDKVIATGHVLDSPADIDFSYASGSGNVSYDGHGASVGEVDLQATSVTGAVPLFGQVRQLTATVKQLPPKVTLDMLNQFVGKDDKGNDVVRKGLNLKAAPAVGSIEALIVSNPGDPAPPGVSPDRQGISVVDTTSKFAAYGRATGVTAARYLGGVDATPTTPEFPLEAHIEHDAGPFDLRYQTDKMTVSGQVLDAPANTDFSYASGSGHMEYDGHGTTAGELDLAVDANASQPNIFGRVRHLEAAVKQLPPKVSMTMVSQVVGKDENGKPVTRSGIDLSATPAVASIEALMTSSATLGRPASVAATGQGAWVIDKTDAYQAFGRATGVSSAHFLGSLPAATDHAEMPYELGVVHDAGPFAIRYEKDHSKIAVDVLDLPATVNMTYFEYSGKVHFDASADIAKVIFSRIDDAPFIDKANRMEATIQGIHQPLDMTVPTPGSSKIDIEASKPIDKVDLRISSEDPSKDHDETVPGGINDTGHSGLLILRNQTRFVVVAHVNGLKGFRYNDKTIFGDPTTDFGLDLANPQKFDGTIYLSDVSTVLVSADKLPTHFDGSLDGGGFNWQSNGSMDLLTLNVFNLPYGPEHGAPHFINGTFRGVPNDFNVSFGSYNTGLTSSSGPFTEVKVDISDLSNFSRFNTELPADRNTLQLGTENGKFNFARIRVFDVKLGNGGQLGASILAAYEFNTAPKPFDVLVEGRDNTDSDTEIHVPQPPRKLDLTAEADDHVFKFNYDTGGEEIPEVDVKSTSSRGFFNAGSAESMVHQSATEATVKDLPPKLTFCITGEHILAGAYCTVEAPTQFSVDPCLTCHRRIVTMYNDSTVNLIPTGATKPLLLEHLRSCNGDELARDFNTKGFCLTRGDDMNFTDIRNLRAHGHVQFETAMGRTEEVDDDNTVIDDGLLKLYVDTDPGGVNIEHLETWNAQKDDRMQVIANDFGDPLRGEKGFAVVDTDTLPEPSLETASGSLHCDHIEIRTAVPIVGTIDIEPLLPICD